MGRALNFDMWSPEYQADLYAIYQHLRDDHPIFKYQSDSNVTSNCWILSRYDDVQRAFRDKLHFVNGGTRNDLVHQLQTSDGDLHTGLRSKVFPLMGAAVTSPFEPLVKHAVAEIFDTVAEQQACDLVQDIALQIPKRIVPAYIGFPDHLTEPLLTLVAPLAGWDPDNPVFPGPDVAQDLINLVEEIIHYKSDHPGADVISTLLALEKTGELAPGGAALIIRSFSFAAFDTTVNLLANGTVLLADNPDQRQQLIDSPELMPRAIEEMLRLE
ncbi:MAG: cytochrome P450, partial [Halioglobus sp.]|nr:cytochrome P450 [Halioglobus sp.]